MNEIVGEAMAKKIISNVPRYYEPYVENCFTSSYGTLMTYMGLNPRILLSDYLSFMYDEEMNYIGTNFLIGYQSSVELTEELLNTSFEFNYLPATTYFNEQTKGGKVYRKDKVNISWLIHDDPDVAYARTKELLDSNMPVMAFIDLFYMPYHSHYQNKHQLHAIIITGYDEESGIYYVFDKYLMGNCDFDGQLPIELIKEARRSSTPIVNPVIGETTRPLRNLWIEFNIDPAFAITEESIQATLEVSCRRMRGQTEVLGRKCGLETMEVFRQAILSRKEQPLDERAIHLFRHYYLEQMKTIGRSRTRFKLFMEDVSYLFPQELVSEVCLDLTESAKLWVICSSISLKLGISKKVNLFDDLADKLAAIIELEGKITEQLSQCVKEMKLKSPL